MNNQTQNLLGKSAILNSALIGFEFEFYSSKKFIRTAKELTKRLGKTVTTAYKLNDKGEKVPGSHTDLQVDYSNYKLEHDFSGGITMMELVTGPTPFFESKVILAKVLSWIKDNGKTTNRCGIHVNISFDKYKTPDKNIDISILDPLKFILTFDEDEIFRRFPHRKDNLFAKSIDFVLPINMFSFNDNIKTVNRSSFSVPNEKYFGFNFSKLQKGYVEMRYLGGKNYEDKIADIMDLMDYSILTAYKCLSLPNYDQDNLDRLRDRMANHKKFTSGLLNHRVFQSTYKNVNLYVDLKNEDQVIGTYWNEIKNVLFDLIYTNGLKSGHVNLDTDAHRYQIRDGVFSAPWKLKDYDLVNCRIKNSIIEGCVIMGCHVTDSQLFYSDLTFNNKFENVKIKSSHIRTTDNYFTNCYIDNLPHNIKGELTKCIVRSGGISELSRIDDKTTIINV